MLNADAARTALRTAGVRLTPQRLMVVEALVGNYSHPTVDQVYERVRQKYPTVSLATVYHTVALLARHSLILELHGGGEGLRCDPQTTPHAHAYCRHCSRVFDVPLPGDLAWQEQTLDGFCPTHFEVSLHGVCAACKSSSSDLSAADL
ncbi:MAG: Fur family transcriptional regulator [Armatimonadota bacterium]